MRRDQSQWKAGHGTAFFFSGCHLNFWLSQSHRQFDWQGCAFAVRRHGKLFTKLPWREICSVHVSFPVIFGFHGVRGKKSEEDVSGLHFVTSSCRTFYTSLSYILGYCAYLNSGWRHKGSKNARDPNPPLHMHWPDAQYRHNAKYYLCIRMLVILINCRLDSSRSQMTHRMRGATKESVQ